MSQGLFFTDSPLDVPGELASRNRGPAQALTTLAALAAHQMAPAGAATQQLARRGNADAFEQSLVRLLLRHSANLLG